MSTARKIAKKTLLPGYKAFMKLYGSFSDPRSLDPKVPISKLVSHSKYMNYLAEIGNRKGTRILEIGSREVTGKSDARERFSDAEYVGFDFYPGPNVDVVGDAHRLSRYFDGQTFDIIYSSAVFEHFCHALGCGN